MSVSGNDLNITGTGIGNNTMNASLSGNAGASTAELRRDTIGSTQNRSVTAMGFGVTNINLMSTGAGSEYVNKLTTGMTEAYKKYQFQDSEKPRISVFDNQVIRKLTYSAIVVHLATSTRVSYFTVLMAATGPKPKTATEVIAEYQNATRIGGQKQPLIFVAADAMNDELHKEIRKALTTQYGNKTIQSVDGLVIPHTVHNVEDIAIEVAAIAYNSCNLENLLSGGVKSDLNITQAREMAPYNILKAEANLLVTTSVDSVTNPVRTDFLLELNSINTQTAMQNLNTDNPIARVVETGGYIDSLPDTYTYQPAPNMPVIQQVRLRPHLVLTHLGAYAHTPGLAMLGLLTGLIMANNDMYLACLIPKDGPSSIRNTGALNVLTNLEKNPNGNGEIMNLADKKRNPDEIYGILRTMYSLSSFVSLDVELFGTQTSYTSMFAIASDENNTSARKAAAKNIIDTANQLTNGAFPANFNPDAIFATSGVPIPLGRWSDKSGERDIRDVDAAFIATHTNNVDMINEWALTNLPKSKTGRDPYMTKVDIISKLIPNAIITGKAIRVTFSDIFINTLIDAAIQAGYDVKYDPQVKVLQNNTHMIGHYLHNNGINSGAAVFARQHAMAGPNYQTTYGFGGNRYGY